VRGKLALLLILILALGFLAARLFPREKAEHYPDFGGGEDEKLLPVDQGKENPDFLRFREELQSAVERKDLEYLKRHLSDKIRYTFGENHSTRGFLRAWKLDEDPSSSEFWAELDAVLSLGGTFNNEEKTIFTAPYVYTRFPEKFDPFQHQAVIAKGVKVYEKPDREAKVLGKLDYSIVKVQEEVVQKGKESWLKIQNSSGEEGFIQARYARSPVDYRASFQKTESSWELIFFVAGD
jgi:hypothetical protein